MNFKVIIILFLVFITSDINAQMAGTDYGEMTNAERQAIVDHIADNMVRVDGGAFWMGSSTSEDDDERPVHKVTLSSYYICRFEVTQREWQAVMGNNPSHFKGSDDLPVEYVSWEECQIFISKLSRMTGKNYRLPTEAEWEFAARGGNKSHGYEYSGSDGIASVAWYFGNSSEETHPVGTKNPNELGLYDMSGNVCEWCQDWYSSYPSYLQANPTGSISGSLRVNRGGGWIYFASRCRLSFRYWLDPSNHYFNLGLRLAL